ncbi:MAG: hypothetical protein OXP71_03040 [Candidatus Poribacteria bacterium]|nr:hypothetical protein [Candidatus Poribacteria bacterium]
MYKTEILSRIPSKILAVLQEIGQLADETGLSAYAVGGMVRDLLLIRENSDFDVVVEGDAIGLAQCLFKRWEGKIHVHSDFGTGTLTRSDGLKIDFVSARRETYPRPGALPFIRFGTILDDLRRRDFSINALAMSLNPATIGELVDCTSGLRDLQSGEIRTLHDRSFIDDPTRLFRAIRYEGRYGFQIVDSDQKHMFDAIGKGVLDLISGQRIRNEINRILPETSAPKIIRRMEEFDIFQNIHTGWQPPENFDALCDAARQAADWADKHLVKDSVEKASLFWMALLRDGSVIESVKDRLSLDNQLSKILVAKARLGNVLAKLSVHSERSQVYKLLKSYPIEALAFSIAEPEQPQWCAAKIKEYLTDLRLAQPLINGADLIQLNLTPGPKFAEMLWNTFAAQLDGKIQSKQEAFQILGRFNEN